MCKEIKIEIIMEIEVVDLHCYLDWYSAARAKRHTDYFRYPAMQKRYNQLERAYRVLTWFEAPEEYEKKRLRAFFVNAFVSEIELEWEKQKAELADSIRAGFKLLDEEEQFVLIQVNRGARNKRIQAEIECRKRIQRMKIKISRKKLKKLNFIKFGSKSYTLYKSFADGLEMFEKRPQLDDYNELKYIIKWNVRNKRVLYEHEWRSREKRFIESFETEVEGEETLFCDTEFLEKIFGKSVKKSEKCE